VLGIFRLFSPSVLFSLTRRSETVMVFIPFAIRAAASCTGLAVLFRNIYILSTLTYYAWGTHSPTQEVAKKMTDTKQTKLSTVDEFLEETGFGKKLIPGDVVIIRAVSFTESMYGEVALLDTDEGRRYTGATALVDFCKRLSDHPDYLPMRVEVTETVSDKGRTYQVFR
jgi:hypothetical protein